MRFRVGDVVRKKPGYGFVGEPLICVIPDTEENREPEPCWCDDNTCIEWPTLWALGDDGKPLDGPAVCHVGECGMELVSRNLDACPSIWDRV